jgi:hypothetical protein
MSAMVTHRVFSGVAALPAVVGVAGMIASNVQTESEQDSFSATDACLVTAAMGMFVLYIPAFSYYVSTRFTPAQDNNKGLAPLAIRCIGLAIAVFGIVLFVLALVGSTSSPNSYEFAKNTLTSGGLLVGYFTVAVLIVGALAFTLKRVALDGPTQRRPQYGRHEPAEQQRPQEPTVAAAGASNNPPPSEANVIEIHATSDGTGVVVI